MLVKGEIPVILDALCIKAFDLLGLVILFCYCRIFTQLVK